MKRTSSFVPLILGIIGGVFAIIGGSCAAFLSDFANAVGESSYLIWGYLSLASGILGLIGGCISRKTGLGSIIMILSAVISIICLVFLGAIWTIIVGIVLFAIGGVTGIIKREE